MEQIERAGPPPLTVLTPPPHRIAPETWLIPALGPEPSGAFASAHSLLIRGAEPIIVDTGVSLLRDSWLERVFSIVDPLDVRWVFVSHDDHDHIGNLETVLELCPRATLVGTFWMTSRLAGDVPLPLERMRWLDPGQSFHAGDRTLTAVRPPLFDSPSTRGLYDHTSRVLWAVDSFIALVPGEVYERDDVPDDLHEESFDAHNSWNTPWMEWVEPGRFAAHLATTAALDVEVVASAHGPLLRGQAIADAYRRVEALAGRPAAATPGQELLDQMVAVLTAEAGEVTAAG
jgi:flavorubredoxin